MEGYSTVKWMLYLLSTDSTPDSRECLIDAMTGHREHQARRGKGSRESQTLDQFRKFTLMTSSQTKDYTFLFPCFIRVSLL